MYGDRLDLPRTIRGYELAIGVDRMLADAELWFWDRFCAVERVLAARRGVVFGSYERVAITSCQPGYGVRISLGSQQEIARAHQHGFAYVYIQVDPKLSGRPHAGCRCMRREADLAPGQVLALVREKLLRQLD